MCAGPNINVIVSVNSDFQILSVKRFIYIRHKIPDALQPKPMTVTAQSSISLTQLKATNIKEV